MEAALQNDEIAHKLTHEELQNDDLDSQQTTDSLPMDSNAPPVIKQEFHVSAIHQNSGSSSSAQTIPASLSIAKTLPSILPLPPTVSIEYSDLCETSRRYLCECQAKGL